MFCNYVWIKHHSLGSSDSVFLFWELNMHEILLFETGKRYEILLSWMRWDNRYLHLGWERQWNVIVWIWVDGSFEEFEIHTCLGTKELSQVILKISELCCNICLFDKELNTVKC